MIGQPACPKPGAGRPCAACMRADAAQNLVNCLYFGTGRNRDPARARVFYRRAVEGGLAKAKCALGNLLVRGEGGPREIDAGLALCRSAAEAGSADAQTDLGGYLLVGTVVPRDPVAARRWLTPVAEQDQANAAFLLAQIHDRGDGTPADPAAAVRWWTVAHGKGRADAAYHLGMKPLRQALVEREGHRMFDSEPAMEARRWLVIAAGNDPDAAPRAKAAEVVADLDLSLSGAR